MWNYIFVINVQKIFVRWELEGHTHTLTQMVWIDLIPWHLVLLVHYIWQTHTILQFMYKKIFIFLNRNTFIGSSWYCAFKNLQHLRKDF